MRLRRPRIPRVDAPSRRTRREPGGSPPHDPPPLLRTVLSALADLLAIAREMLVWPLRLWLAVAEVAGQLVLAAWLRAALPLLRGGLRGLRAALHLGERELTPARGLALVALAATIALGASQFTDYRAVEVGADDYRGVQSVAAAPQVAHS